MSKSEIWKHLDRMQKVCMAKESILSKEEFFQESESDQKRYYNWMLQQVSSFTAGPYWY